MNTIIIGRKTAVFLATIFLSLFMAGTFAIGNVGIAHAAGTYSNVTISNATVNILKNGTNPVIYAPTADGATIDVADINAELDNGNAVIINTENTTDTGTQRGDITVTTAVVKSSGVTDADITMNANGTIAVDANITNINAGAITLNANVAGTTPGAFNGITLNGSQISSGTGDISLTGTTGDSGTQVGVRIRTGINLVTTGGDITIIGTSSSDEGVEINGVGGAGQVIATGSGTVTIEGTSTATSGTGSGVFLGNATNADVTAVDGNISITGNATTSEGVMIWTSGEVSTSGTGGISVTGTSDTRHGVYFNAATIASTGTGITIDGTGGTTADTYGVTLINNSQINATGNANVTIDGTGGTGDRNDGVRLQVGGGAITAVDGNITIIGESQNALSSEGIGLHDGSSISSTGTGDITLTATANASTLDYFANNATINSGPSGSLTLNGNTILLANASNMSGSGDLTIQPRTAGTTIGLGGGTGTLALSDTELALLTNGFNSITIGNSNAGNIDLNTAGFSDPLILRGASTSDNVTAGNDLAATSVRFDADVHPGQSPGILRVNGDTTFVNGNELVIELGGTTAGDGAGFHDQVDVAGMVTIESSVALSLAHFGGFTPANDDIFIIVDNDDVDAVVGTFDGLAEGASFMVDGETYIISYVGGDGNDIVLTANPTPPITPGGVGANLALWVKANDGVNDTGGTVTGWADQLGTNIFAVNGDPQTNATEVNFNNVIDFDGTDDSLTGDTPITFVETFAAAFQNGGGIIVSGETTRSGSDCGAYSFFSQAGTPNLYIADDDTPNQGYILSASDMDTFRLLNSEFVNTATNTDSRIAINGGDTLVADWGGNVGNNDGLTSFTHEPIVGACGTVPLSWYMNGSLGEVIVYSNGLNAADRNKVNTYLAIKYGITLYESAGVGSNYTLSDGTVVWNATTNSAYHNDVAGISRDDDSAQDQPKSLSINSDAMVTMDGTGNIGANLSALLWGNNDGTTALDQAAGSYLHMARVWKTAETGSVGNVVVSIPDSYGATHLLVSNSTDFSGATAVVLTNAGGSSSATFNFSDGQYFTFANLGALPANNIGNALNFDGINDYVNIPTDSSLTPVSAVAVEAWVRMDGFVNYAGIVGNVYDSGVTESGYGLYTRASNEIDFFVKTTTTPAGVGWGRCLSGVLNTGQWYHVAGVYDGASLKMYIDGVEVCDTPVTGNIVYTPANDMKIGSYIDNDEAHYFDGQIDEVRIWNTARTIGEIGANMHGELTGSHVGLVAYYQMENGQGKGATAVTSLSDMLDTNHGTLMGMNGLTEWNGRLWTSDTIAESGGLAVTDAGFLQDNGDDFTFWFTDQTNDNVPNDLPAGVEQRWQRVWSCSIEDAGSNNGFIDLTFDFDDARMGGLAPAGPLTNYVLLHRLGTSGDFSVLIDGADSMDAGEKTVTFANVNLATTSLCSEITIGTKDAATSPTAVSLQSFLPQTTTNVTVILLVGTILAILTGVVFINQRKEQ